MASNQDRFCGTCGSPRSPGDNVCPQCGRFYSAAGVDPYGPTNPAPRPTQPIWGGTPPPFYPGGTRPGVTPPPPLKPPQSKQTIIQWIVIYVLLLLVAALAWHTFSGSTAPAGTPSPGVVSGSTATRAASTATRGPAPTATAAAPTATVAPSCGPGCLYKADWSNEANGWAGAPDWKFVNGMLLNDGTDNLCLGFSHNFSPTLAPPYQPAVADYAIEIQAQIVRQTMNGCVDQGSFGFVARGMPTSDGSAWTGYQAIIDFSNSQVSIGDYSFNQEVLQQTNLQVGTDWRTYRLVVQGTSLKLFLDGALILSTSDAKYLTAGQLGLWSASLYLNIRSYEVDSV